MDFIGQKVHHKHFGMGVIIDIKTSCTQENQKHILVAFGKAVKKFLFPQIFESYLTAIDSSFTEAIKTELEKLNKKTEAIPRLIPNVTKDFSKERSQPHTSSENKKIMRVGNTVEANTHAEFLNRLLNKHYAAYMRCGYNLDSANLIWMIRLDGQASKERWINELSYDGNCITENFVGLPSQMRDSHILTDYYQKRYVFDIIETHSYCEGYKRKYVFVGVFELDRSCSNNKNHVWKLIKKEVDFSDF